MEFRNVIARCAIKDFGVIQDFFFAGLNRSLCERIHCCETMPKDPEALYSKAAQLENQWRLGKAYTTQKSTKSSNQYGGRRPYVPQKERDPDAMDIDRMTAEEQEKHFKEGRCFTCHKIGHLSRNCPDKRTQNRTTQNRTNAHVTNIEDCDNKSTTSHSSTATTASRWLVAARVRLALKDLDSEVEREEVLKEVCDEGF